MEEKMEAPPVEKMEAPLVEKMIDVFSDDLFQYLFPRRINVFYYRNPENKSNGLPDLFHPYIGMSVLCESQRRQKDLFAWFGTYYPDFISDRLSYMTFCANMALQLKNEYKDDVIKTSISVASMILELSVFCHLRGYQKYKYFSGICWAEIFKYFLAQDFFSKHDWSDFKKFAESDAKIYLEGKHYVYFDQNKLVFTTDWLSEYDYWASVYVAEENVSPGQETTSEGTEELSAPSDESRVLETSFGSEDRISEYQEDVDVSTRSPVIVSTRSSVIVSTQSLKQLDSGSIKMIELEQTPAVQQAEFLTQFKRIIFERDYSRELFIILESEQQMDILTGSSVFLRFVTDTVENSAERMKNEDILELLKMILLGNEDLAMFFVKATRFVTLTDSIGTIRSDLLGSGEGIPEASGVTDETTNSDILPQGAKPPRKQTVKRTSSGIDKTKACNKANVKLIGEFKYAISGGTDLESVEICEILESKEYVYPLLDNHVFRSMMELTIKFPVKQRWGNRWILSFMKSLIKYITQPPEFDFVQPEMPKCSTQSSSETRVAKITALNKLSAIQNPPDTSSPDPSLSDSNAKLQPHQPDDSCESEDLDSVYVDIVNLSTSVKQLLVDVLKEKDACNFPEIMSPTFPKKEASCDNAEDPQKKSKSKRKNRKRKNRRRNKGNESKADATETGSDPVKESAAKTPEDVEGTYCEDSNSDSDNENSVHDLGQRMGRLGIGTVPRKKVEPLSSKQCPNLQKKDSPPAGGSFSISKGATSKDFYETEQRSTELVSDAAVSDFNKILNIIPPYAESAVFDFLLHQVMDADPKFLENLKEDKCIDEDQMRQLMEHRDRHLMRAQRPQMSASGDNADEEQVECSNPTATVPPSEVSMDNSERDETASPSHSVEDMSTTGAIPKVPNTPKDE